MTDRYTTYAFIAGELAPEFYSRSDLDKYALGVSLAENFLVDFRGGMKTAPGTAFVDTVAALGRLQPFPVSSGVSEVLLYFGPETLVIYDPTGEETIVTPYLAADLSTLSFHYKNLRLVITHPDYAPHELTYDGTDWDFGEIVQEISLPAPTGLTVTTHNNALLGVDSGDAKAVFVVTSIDADGNESVGSTPVVFDSLFNYAAEAGSALVSWNAVAGAVAYRIYRSAIVEEAAFTRAQDVGYIGQSKAPTFVDANVTPDYTVQPPLRFNPFAEGAVIRLNVTAGGTGYAETATVAISGGTGFSGYPLVVGGAVVGIVVVNGGKGFTTGSTVTISGGGGTGATATVAEVSPSEGLFPSCSTVMERRRVYAGQLASPLTLYGSKIGVEGNFDYSPITSAADGYILPIDSEGASPITHMEKQQDSLLIFHRGGVETLRPAEGSGISSVNFQFRTQTNLGASECTPIKVGNDIIYATDKGTQVISLGYTYYTESFQEQDISVLAPHLFGAGLEPVRMVWQREPDKLLWVLRADGTLAVLTYMKAQEIYAWSQRKTNGIIRDICLLKTRSYDYVYLLVQRGESFFIEEMQPRVAYPAEEYWGVDCGLRYEGTPIAGSVKITEVGGLTYITRPTSNFNSSVGKFIRAGRGLYQIVGQSSLRVVQVTVIRAADKFLGDLITTNGPYWTLSNAVSSVSGLDHLEGMQVTVLANGDYLGLFTVTAGALTFAQSYSMITVGLPYTCELHSLPLAEPRLQSDGKTKRVVGSAVRLYETRGLEIGSDTFYEVKPSLPTEWGQPAALMTDTYKLIHESRWRVDAIIKFRQRYPLPACVLGYVTELEAEDQ